MQVWRSCWWIFFYAIYARSSHIVHTMRCGKCSRLFQHMGSPPGYSHIDICLPYPWDYPHPGLRVKNIFSSPCPYYGSWQFCAVWCPGKVCRPFFFLRSLLTNRKTMISILPFADPGEVVTTCLRVVLRLGLFFLVLDPTTSRTILRTVRTIFFLPAAIFLPKHDLPAKSI